MRNIESWQIDKLHIKILSAGPRQLGSVRHLCSGVRWLPQQSVGQITGGGRQRWAWTCGEDWKKHSFWLKVEVRLKEEAERGETALMTLKIGPWLWYAPRVNHRYSLLSAYLSPCPPISPPPCLCLGAVPSPCPSSTSFTSTYSKLPSSSHTCPVAINKCLHASASAGGLWIHSETFHAGRTHKATTKIYSGCVLRKVFFFF